MIFSTLVISAAAGIVLGLIFGLFFALQQRRVFSLPTNRNHFIASSIVFSMSRILIISSLMSYLLLSTSLHLILITIFFVITCCLLLRSHKDLPDGRH